MWTKRYNLQSNTSVVESKHSYEQLTCGIPDSQTGTKKFEINHRKLDEILKAGDLINAGLFNAEECATVFASKLRVTCQRHHTTKKHPTVSSGEYHGFKTGIQLALHKTEILVIRKKHHHNEFDIEIDGKLN
ncbi:hypothetical protein QTP88_008415 [Uroleucon formosanum]